MSDRSNIFDAVAIHVDLKDITGSFHIMTLAYPMKQWAEEARANVLGQNRELYLAAVPSLGTVPYRIRLWPEIRYMHRLCRFSRSYAHML